MHPKFMPKLWSVNFNSDRLTIRAQQGRVTEDELKIAGVEATIEKRKAANSTNLANSTPKANGDTSSSTSSNNNNHLENSLEDDVDSSSEWEYQSAYSYRIEAKNSTDDERYFSDAASFYTMNSFKSDDTSTIADFQSLNSSMNDLTMCDSGDETEKASEGSDTEVEDESNFKMENVN